MITWTVTAFTAHTTTDAIYTTSAEPSLTAARRAAGDAALAALGAIAGQDPAFLSVSIDNNAVLITTTTSAHPNQQPAVVEAIRHLQRAEPAPTEP